ncbi:MAG TPA: efflux RND transporter periplasmic adaptor subunit [Sulfuriferula sp.]|nr:efflux RND transporter periplasmic adaptor subunit [Sulfuriferula sp.]
MMNAKHLKLAALMLIFLAAGAAGGYWWANHTRMNSGPAMTASSQAPAERKPLYWYDPMVPQQHFDKPGKSPFMDMALVPKYADDSGNKADAGSVKIDPRVVQNLGMRTASVTRGSLTPKLEATGVLAFNERDVSIVQARAAGFVERVFARAPGDVVAAGSPLVSLLVPEWSGAQQEFLALKKSGDAALIDAARQRMQVLGMPSQLIQQVERSGVPHPVVTVSFPMGGVIRELDVRAGMTVTSGQTLAKVNGLGTVWLDVAVPEALAQQIRVGQSAQARLPALPGEVIQGRVTDILPEANLDTRTLKVRVELPNKHGHLRPGLTAQVQLADSNKQSVLLVPTEAIIRTGKGAMVMVAESGGHYRPVEVQTGAEAGGQTAVLGGLSEGQKVVTSGQFLIDSDASLQGIFAAADAPDTGTAPASTQVPAPMALHEAEGRIVGIGKDEVTIAHGPFKTLNMPGMTMSFPLANAHLIHGFKVGDKVRVGMRQTDSGLVIERLEKNGGAK